MKKSKNDYAYNPNTSRRIFVIFMIISVILVGFSTSKIYAWPFQSLSDKAGQITDEVIEGVTTTSTTVVETLGQGIMKVFTQSLKPDFSAFNKLATLNGITIEEAIYSYAKDIGIIIAFMILLFGAYAFFFAKAEEPQDTPLSLIMHFFLAMVIIMASREFINAIINDADTLWQSNVMTYQNTNMGDNGFDAFSSIVVENGNQINLFPSGIIVTLSIALTSAIGWVAGLISLIIILILFIPYIKALLRLYFEILQRYIIWCFMLLFLPCAAATMVSNTTIRIWKSYVRMLVSTLLIFLTQVFLFAISVDITLSGFISKGVAGYFLGISFITFAGRFDTYLARLGISVAQTGGRLFQDASSGLRDMVRSIDHTNNLRRNLGGAVLSAGAASGNISAVKAGMAMKNPGGALSSGFGKTNPDKKALAEIGKNTQGSIKAAPSVAKGIMSDYLSNPHNNDNRNALSAMSDASKVAGLNEMFKDSGNDLLNDITATGLSVDDKTGNINFEGINGDKEEISGTLSGDELSKGIELSDGSYLSLDNQINGSVDDDGKNNSQYSDFVPVLDENNNPTLVEDSDRCKIPINQNAESLLMKSGNLALASQMDQHKELQGVASVEMSGDNTRLMDSNGVQIGLITGDGSYFKANRGEGAEHDARQAFGMTREAVEAATGFKIANNADDTYNLRTADNMSYRKVNSSTYEVPTVSYNENGQQVITAVRITAIGNSDGNYTVGPTRNGQTKFKGTRFEYGNHSYTARKIISRKSQSNETDT
ncbi:MAG: hypothetical protein K2K56_15270 [Lachnospiraceae bacterium]|nr:hypothetical protein [Lachnospiraceae bacterium]